MSRTRVIVLITLLFTLVPPSALLAQDAQTEFPVAVAALEGAFEPSADGQGCELLWQNAGTPTLRVASSNGDRYREDLVGGQLISLPDVDEGRLCLFVVEVAIGEGRSYEFSLEGSDLARISEDEIANLTGTAVLPVEMDQDGEFVLASDDYLDVELDLNAQPDTGAVTDSGEGTESGSRGADAPGGLRPVEPPQQETEEATALATPGTPGATPVVGGEIRATVNLFVYKDLEIKRTGGCRVTLADEDAFLTVETSTGDVADEESLTVQGRTVNEETSPLGERGCLFEFTMNLAPSDSYTFRVGGVELATVPAATLQAQDEPLLLAIDSKGNRTPAIESVTEPAPEATPGEASMLDVQSGPLGDGQFQIVGRLDLLSDETIVTDAGCTGGPGNEDISPGAQVIIRNESDTIIGYGVLQDSGRTGVEGCSYDFVVIVPDATFYVIEVSDRGRVVYSVADMERTNWRVIIEAGER
jgi:hypothetical protein